ncbi:UDP-glucose 4-epimerase GalE [Xenophilus sp. Marseille-Q4582]|uniref:UDP-glucose 4-epimerase GalE n=1 Tax=Xenophilus sp. Marseille-Q4582 TaxID=2866600 RepID=UPI001CE46E87|nr:UDP-glucose 4-epimerase GalE [Xenophilus sp. Marseille-Q4582]
MKYLICGGAGYIGAHLCKWLARVGHEVTVLDNLSTGHRAAVRWGRLIEADIVDRAGLFRALEGVHADAVVHLCARSLVGESMAVPYDYYANNVAGTLNVLEWMRTRNVDKFLFSSTAAVFGHPQAELIDEGHPTLPINPYGRSKLMVERILQDAAQAHGLRSVALRYFNACGADEQGDIGESHEPETHLIPNVLRAALSGERVRIFGDDYPTPDGTCVRDYVHVNDLASAHELALKFMACNEGAHVFNLGNGCGFSVKQVLAAAEEVVGRAIAAEAMPRRPGDPPVLVAASRKAREVLGWSPAYTDMTRIIDTAWRWHRNPAY